MISSTAIRADGLGKRYLLGALQQRHTTLRDALAAGARRWLSPAAAVARLRRPRRHAEREIFWALRDVSFEIQEGEAVGIIGANGAGKTTLLKILARITEPTTGEARVRGRIGSLLEVGTGFHTELTGRENIYLNGAILGMRRTEIRRKFDEIVAFSEIERFVDTPVKHYSSGLEMRLAFAIAAHLEPEILLVDEVLAVGDARFQRKCLGKMEEVSTEQGRTVLFVSHNMLAVESLCDRVLWMRNGSIAAEGSPKDLVSRYLGSAPRAARYRFWADPREAPGNEEVVLRRAGVGPAGDTEDGAMDVRTPLQLILEYWSRKPGARINPSVFVYNEHDVLVFNIGPTEAPEPRAPGLYQDVCRIPGDLMNDGRYRLDLLMLDGFEQVLYKHEGLLSFDVLDRPDLRGGWHGEWLGTVRPHVEWHSRRVAERTDPEAPALRDRR